MADPPDGHHPPAMIDLTLHLEGTTRFTISVERFVLKNHRNGYRQVLGMSLYVQKRTSAATTASDPAADSCIAVNLPPIAYRQ